MRVLIIHSIHRMGGIDAGTLDEKRLAPTRASMGVTDFIGGRGEAIAFTRLTQICTAKPNLPYFWPHYLGEKCETFDFLVELVGAGEMTPFFFAQVKSTRQKFNKAQTHLRVRVAKKRHSPHGSIPGPYLCDRRP